MLLAWEERKILDRIRPNSMAVEGPVRRATAVNRRLVPQADFESELRETLGDHPENEETSAREFLTGGGVKSDVSALPPHPDAEVRRREGHAGKAGKFKTVSQLVLAMNRFKGEPECLGSTEVLYTTASFKTFCKLIMSFYALISVYQESLPFV